MAYISEAPGAALARATQRARQQQESMRALRDKVEEGTARATDAKSTAANTIPGGPSTSEGR